MSMSVSSRASVYVDASEQALKLSTMVDEQVIDNGEEEEEGWEV